MPAWLNSLAMLVGYLCLLLTSGFLVVCWMTWLIGRRRRPGRLTLVTPTWRPGAAVERDRAIERARQALGDRPVA